MKNLGALLLIGLVVYSVVDVLSSTKDERIGLPRWAWVVLLILVPLVGSIVWIAVSRMQRARPQPSGSTGRSLAPAPVAPDDDPEFLWTLDQRRRQAEQRRTLRTSDENVEGRAAGPGRAHDARDAEHEADNRETGPDAGDRPRS